MWFIVLPVFPQDSTEVPVIEVVQLNSHIWEISIAGCNHVVSIGNDGVFLVDANYKELCRYLINVIDSLGGKEVDYVVNTHWHFDHVGCNLIFGYNSKIISSKKNLELLSEDRFLLGDTIKALPYYALPEIVFDDEYRMRFNGEIIEMFILAGHTCSDVIVYFPESNIVHIGDLIFGNMFSFVDINHGGNVLAIYESVKKLCEILPVNTKIIMGHGMIYSVEDLRKHGEMVKYTYDIVRKKIESGMSPEEIKKQEVLNEYKEWGKAFNCDNWIDYICESVKKNKQ